LDFSSGLLNLGNTVATLSNFLFDANGIGKAYEFNIDLCTFTLPLALMDFNGRVSEKAIQLNWVSENELNVNNYELQRSADGANFETIALIFAQNESHNVYKYPDMHPYHGVNYYRLKMIDYDKKTSNSKTISFVLANDFGVSMIVAPNPAREIIRIRLVNLSSGEYSLHLVNAAGQLKTVRKINITQSEQLETIKREPGMPPGVYWLQLYKDGHIVRTANMVIGD